MKGLLEKSSTTGPQAGWSSAAGSGAASYVHQSLDWNVLQTGEGSFAQLTAATKFAAHFSCSRLNPPRWQPLHLVGEHGPALGDGASKLSLVHVREHLCVHAHSPSTLSKNGHSSRIPAKLTDILSHPLDG